MLRLSFFGSSEGHISLHDFVCAVSACLKSTMKPVSFFMLASDISFISIPLYCIYSLFLSEDIKVLSTPTPALLHFGFLNSLPDAVCSIEPSHTDILLFIISLLSAADTVFVNFT